MPQMALWVDARRESWQDYEVSMSLRFRTRACSRSLDLILGIVVSARSIPTAVMACGVMGGLVATFDASGRSLTGGHAVSETPDDREERRQRFFKKPPPFGNQSPSLEAKEGSLS